MSSFDDAPVVFFMEHQQQIAAWAQLAKDAQSATAAALEDVQADLVRDERVAAADILVGHQVAGEIATGPVLYHTGWATHSDAPDVAVGLSWDGPVDPARVWPGTSRPYTGVLTSHSSAVGKQIEVLLRQHPDSEYGGGSKSPRPRVRAGSHWVVYRPIESPPDWWRDVDAWRRGWVDQLLADWTLWAPLIDSAVRTSPESAASWRADNHAASPEAE